MGRSLKYDIPGDDPRVTPAEVAEMGWEKLFATPAVPGRGAMILEIGFGRGEFLLAMAHASPETCFVGIEVSFKRTLKMARKVARARLANVRLMEARAELAIREHFAEASLDEIWINFSDPWPKTRHAHRRLIQPPFVADVARALRPGGRLFVATDDVPYAHQIDEVLAGEGRLENEYTPWPFLAEVTDRMQTGYEEQWRAEGRPLQFFAYRPLEGNARPLEGNAR